MIRKSRHPWSYSIECRRCDLYDYCMGIREIIKNYNKHYGKHLKYRCPILDDRDGERYPDK